MDENTLSERAPRAGGETKVALVHDWLTGMRGGEKCLKVLCELLPHAEVFTLFHLKGRVDPVIESRSPHPSFLQALPGIGRYYRYLLPLFPLAVEGFDLQDYPLIISISHCVAKGILPGPSSRHICYCLTPVRYLWDQYRFYFGEDARRALPRGFIRVLSHYLRLWDVSASRRVDDFVAVSSFVARRIRRYYRREARVIYPPVEWSRYGVEASPEKDYYLVIAPNAPYKRLGLVLEAFSGGNRYLKVAGCPMPGWVRRIRHGAGGKVEWLGWVPDEELVRLFANCRALIFPGVEDFGLVPVEVQASGRPVVAYGRGGALESVRGIPVQAVPKVDRARWLREGWTGVFFEEPTARALREAIECFESVEDRFDPQGIRQWARQFDRVVFERRWKDFLKEKVRDGWA